MDSVIEVVIITGSCCFFFVFLCVLSLIVTDLVNLTVQEKLDRKGKIKGNLCTNNLEFGMVTADSQLNFDNTMHLCIKNIDRETCGIYPLVLELFRNVSQITRGIITLLAEFLLFRKRYIKAPKYNATHIYGKKRYIYFFYYYYYVMRTNSDKCAYNVTLQALLFLFFFLSLVFLFFSK